MAQDPSSSLLASLSIKGICVWNLTMAWKQWEAKIIHCGDSVQGFDSTARIFSYYISEEVY